MSMTLVYLIATVFLIMLNAFFVLAEFASVKARPTHIEVLASRGDRRARMARHIQSHIDDYLSVCQVGITLASIGLGFVSEPTFVKIILPLLEKIGLNSIALPITSHALAIALAYILVSYLHIVLGELIPKSVAIRRTEKSVLLIAYPLRVFRFIFLVPIWILNSSVNLILRLIRIPPVKGQEKHSESEIRVILDRSESGGMMSFRRLLYIENILDMGQLTIRNAMKPASRVRCLKVGADQENDRLISTARHSRYPLLEGDNPEPLGYIHLKDLFLAIRSGKDVSDLKAFVRPCLNTKETASIEQVLSIMQRKGNHIALVHDEKGVWTGFVTMEDLLEEVVGAVEEEFPLEEPVYLADVLTAKRVVLGVEGETVIEATRNALERIDATELPVPVNTIMLSVAEREKMMSSFVGYKLAIPHARISGLARPLMIVARLRDPIPAPVQGEEIRLLFILLTPEDMPRIHQVLLSHIATLFYSDFTGERLYNASTPEGIYDAIKTAEQATRS